MPAWNLSDLYTGMNDPKILKDLETYLTYKEPKKKEIQDQTL